MKKVKQVREYDCVFLELHFFGLKAHLSERFDFFEVHEEEKVT